MGENPYAGNHVLVGEILWGMGLCGDIHGI
jgi:hypothetical protein